MKTVAYLLCFYAFSPLAFAKSFERFDGQVYNGLYYPKVDAIEWGEADGELPHMEFHIHSKDKPVDLVAVPGDKGGKPVLWLMYNLGYRGERVCRHIVAPAHFREGMKLHAYRDNSDKDYDNIFFYSEPWTKGKGIHVKDYTMPNYERCSDENASNMPGGTPSAAGPASTTAAAGSLAAPGSEGARSPNSAPAHLPSHPKGVGIDYDNNAVPFSF